MPDQPELRQRLSDEITFPSPKYPPAEQPAPTHGYFDNCRYCTQTIRWWPDGWRHIYHGRKDCNPISVGVASPRSGAVGIAGTDLVLPPGVAEEQTNA